MKNFDENKFREDLKELPWDVLDIFDDPNDALSVCRSLFIDIVEIHSPMRSRRVKHPKHPDRITPEILQAINKRDGLNISALHNETRIL